MNAMGRDNSPRGRCQCHQSRERQQQPIQADRPTHAFGVASAAGDLLLRAERWTARLEAVVQIVAEASHHSRVELVGHFELVQQAAQEAFDLTPVLGRATAQQLDADLGELAVAPPLRALVAIAATKVEDPVPRPTPT